jgi:hypothetical protein
MRDYKKRVGELGGGEWVYKIVKKWRNVSPKPTLCWITQVEGFVAKYLSFFYPY